jgi:catechol 2,3-dioxygenase-like lactoylglutathione lyase family enzyme
MLIMKKFHLNLSVKDLDQSVLFYTVLFGIAPTTLKPDYAKWMLEDPSLNFAISHRPETPGIEHVGIQAENEQELLEVYNRMKQAKGTIREEGKTTCCCKERKIMD